MKAISFTGGTLGDFTTLFDQHMLYLKESVEAVGAKKYEDIAGMARAHLQSLEQVISERSNLKATIEKYQADAVAPSGGGDVNAALAALKAEKLAVDGALVTVKAEVEAWKIKHGKVRDKLVASQAQKAN
jgi:hypothetical protein